MSDDGSRQVTDDFRQWWDSLPRPKRRRGKCVRFRLSKLEVLLIRVGLGRIAASYEIVTRTGGLPHDHFPFRILRPRNFDLGEFDLVIMQTTVRVSSLIDSIGDDGGRLRLDVFDLAACILAVRVSLKRVRHGHAQPCCDDQATATKNLIAKLERYRKRAKRAFIADWDVTAYRETHSRWKKYVRWVRVHFLYCGCGRPRFPNSRRRYQLMLKEWMAIAREGLQFRGRPVPPDIELKRIVRLALADCRRGRTGFRPQDILHNHDLGGSYLADFIRDRYRPCQIPAPPEDDLAAMFQ